MSYRINKQSWAIEAHTSQYLDTLGQITNVKNRFSEFNMSEMTRTTCHVPSTCLTLWHPVNDPLSGVHESTNFWTAPFHCVRIAYAIRYSHRHTFLEVVFAIQQTIRNVQVLHEHPLLVSASETFRVIGSMFLSGVYIVVMCHFLAFLLFGFWSKWTHIKVLEHAPKYVLQYTP